jgi:hypothetical protein
LALAVVLTFLLQFFTPSKGMLCGLTNRLFVVMLLSWLVAPPLACADQRDRQHSVFS